MKKFSLVLRKHMFSLTLLPLVFLLLGLNATDHDAMIESEPITEEEMVFDCTCPFVKQLEISSNGYLCCSNDSGNQVAVYDSSCPFSPSAAWTWVWVAKKNCTISSNGSNLAIITPTTCDETEEAVFAIRPVSNTSGCVDPFKGKVFRLPIMDGGDDGINCTQ